MNDIEELKTLIVNKILETYAQLKTELFHSNGEIFDRHWDDLSPAYKKYKAKRLGSAYPINIFTGKLIQSLIENALSISIDYNQGNDTLTYKIEADTERLNLKYADFVNEKREYIDFSKEEKQLLLTAIIETIKDFYENR